VTVTRRDVLEMGGCERDPVRATAGMVVTGLRAFAATVGTLESGELDSG
jgi:hypothetical protein